jgi:DNA-binding transcriptional MerR regulator
MNQQLRTAAQAARAFGVTVKSLRVWERMGLLAPGRTVAGWRLYGSNEFARIHQVLALKSLGLGLAEVAGLLKDQGADIDAVLKLQAKALERRKLDAEKGLATIDALRVRLRTGERPSLEDFASLIRDTTGEEKLTASDVASIFQPYVARHFTPDEMERMRERELGVQSRSGAQSTTWDAMFVEARKLMISVDPSTAAAADFARRWNALAAPFHLGDPVIAAKTKAVWEDALSTPGRSAPLPTTQEMVALVEAASRSAGRRDRPCSGPTNGTPP